MWEGQFQGSRSHLLGLYAAAARISDEFEFVFLTSQPDSLKAADPAFSLPHVQVERMAPWPRSLRLTVQLPLLRRRLGLDVMHLQYRVPPLGGGHWICTIHDVLYATHPQFFEPRFGAMLRLTGRLAARRADRILTVSEYSKRAIAGLYGVDTDRIAVTPNGVDTKRFHPHAGCTAALAARDLLPGRYFLTVGRLEPRKNHLGLLAAYRQLPSDAPPLVIVGQRDFGFSALLEALEAPELRGRVHLLEDVDDAALPVLIRHASALVYPALAEGFGIPVIEGMACGTPVITSDNTALAEVAAEAADVVDPTDAGAVAAAMWRVYRDPQRREELIRRGLQRAAQFQWEPSAEVLLRTCREVLGRPA